MSDFEQKQVIVIRTDLKMSKGKIAAQAGHAAVSSAEESRKRHPQWWRTWIEEGQCKVAVKAANEEELLILRDKAEKLGLPHALIIDRGLTELAPNTTTCIGIGPAPSRQVDKVTGDLKLF